jgi:hypothetical protein
MKVLSLTCEQSVRARLLDMLSARGGVRNARVTETRMEELDGDTPVDLHETQYIIECVVNPETVGPIVDALVADFLPHFDVGFYVHDALVLRPRMFAKG